MKKSIFLFGSLAVFSVFHSSSTWAGFGDVPDTHPFKAAIDYVQSEKIVSGYPDGTYQPDKVLNRAEFTKIIIASRFPKSAINGCIFAGRFYKTKVFKDIDPKIWFENFVCMAKTEDIIGGYGDGSFKPTNTINLAEAAKITVKSYGLKTSGGTEPWFASYIYKLKELNAIPYSIKDPMKDATKQISRGEMADIVYRLRQVQDLKKDTEQGFSLRVPEVALPSGVSSEKITIAKLAKADQPMQDVSGAPMLFYKLDPPGTSFNEPIRFEIEVPTVGNTIPMIFFVSGDKVEMIPTPTIEMDPGNGIAFLTAEISHFSEIGISEKSPISFELQEGPSTALEDEPFTTGFTITWDPEASREIAYQKGDTEIRYDGKWTVFGVGSQFTGSLISAKTDELSEEGVEEGLDNQAVDLDFDRDAADPDAIIISDVQQFFHNETFTCATPGENQTIRYAFNIGWGYVVKKGNQEESVRRVSTVVLKGSPFDCVTEKQNENFMGDLRCAGVRPVRFGQKFVPLDVVQPDEDPNCYLKSDLEERLSEESNCDNDHYAAFGSDVLESLALDRTPRKIIDPDPDGCHFGEIDAFAGGLLFASPDQIKTRVLKLLSVPDPYAKKFASFDGAVNFEVFDETALEGLPDLCDSSDPYSLDGAEAIITVKDASFRLEFPEQNEVPAVLGKIAPNGLVFAEDKSLGKTAVIFVGKIYRVDGLEKLQGTLQITDENCQNNVVMSVEEEG